MAMNDPMAPLGLSWGMPEQPVVQAPLAPPDSPSALPEMTWDTDVLGRVLPPRPAPMAPPSAQAPLTTLASEAQARVQRAAEAKRYLLGSREGLQAGVLATQNGNDLAQQELVRDLETLSFNQIAGKYGIEVARLSNRYITERLTTQRLQAAERPLGQQVSDTVTDAVSGAVSGLTGSLALGVGLVSDEGGAALAQGSQVLREGLKGSRSDLANRKAALDSIADALDAQDNDARYQADRSAHGDTIGVALSRIGREFLSQAENVFSDPRRLTEISAEGIGTVLTTAGIGKSVLGGLTRLAGPKVTNGVIVGIMEGGDAYAGSVAQVMAMSEAELQENSEAYRAARAQGLSHSDAQAAIAGDVGRMAAAIQVPIAAATGAMVGRFEQAPLKAATNGQLRDLAQTLALEGTEETLQEGANSFAGNVGMRVFADPERPLSEGVGGAAALGLAGGVGMAGGLRATAAGLALPGEVVGATQDLVGQGIQKVREARAAALDAENPTSERNLGTLISEADLATERLRRTSPAAPPTSPDTPETQDEPVPVGRLGVTRETLPAHLAQIVDIGDDEVQDLSDPVYATMLSDQAIAQGNGDTGPRHQALNHLRQRLEQGQLQGEVKTGAALFLREQMDRVTNLLDGGVRDYVAQHGTPEQQQDVALLEQTFGRIRSTPSLTQLFEELDQGALAPLTLPQNPSPQQVQNLAPDVVRAAIYSPVLVSAPVAQTVLNQMGDSLSEESQKALKVAYELAVARQKADEQKAEIRKTENVTTPAISAFPSAAPTQAKPKGPGRVSSAQVREDILSRGNRTNGLLPVEGHITEIQQALKVQDLPAAQEALEAMGNFARGLINKHRAMQASKTEAKGNGHRYSYWSPSRGFIEKSETTFTYHGHNQNSRLLAADLEIDAQGVTDLYNKIRELHPELGGDALSLDQSYGARPSPAEGAAARPTGKPTASSTGVPPAPTPTTSPLLETLRAKYPKVTFDPIAPELSARVEGFFATLGFAGLVPLVGRMVDPENPDSFGYADFATRTIWLSDDSLKILAATDAVTDKRGLSRLLMHELGHIVDAAATDPTTGKRASNQARWFRDGDLIQEFRAAQNDPRLDSSSDQLVWPIDFAYVFGFDRLRTQASEAFAELFQFAHAQPELAQEIFPHGLAYLRDVLQRPLRESRDDNGDDSDEQPPTPVTAPAPVTDPAERFPQLIRAGEAPARIWGAVRISLERSRWFSLTNPLTALHGLLRDETKARDFAGTNADRIFGLNAESRQAARDLLSEGVPFLMGRMNARLVTALDWTKPRKDGTVTESLRQAAARGQDITGFSRGRLFGLAQIGPDGQVAYNPEILEGATLASLQWLLEASDSPREPDLRKVAQTFQMSEREVAANPDLIAAYTSGKPLSSAAHELAKRMMGLLGLEPEAQAPLEDSQGMFLSLALEMLRTLHEEGMLQIREFHVALLNEAGEALLDNQGKPRFRDLKTLRFRDPKSTTETPAGMDVWRQKLNGARDLFTLLLVPEAETSRYIGTPPPPIEKRGAHQLKNNSVPLSKAEVTAINHAQNVAGRLNRPMWALSQALGETRFKALLGYTPLKPGTLNRNDAISKQGVNQGLDYAWRETTEYVAALQAYADEHQIPIEQVPFYHAYGITKVGRLQQIGFGAQANKTAREILTTVHATIDLKNPEHVRDFWLSVAQSLGLKTEKAPHSWLVWSARRMVAKGPLGEAVKLLQGHLKGEALDGARFEALVREGLGKDLNAKALHGLLAVARFKSAPKTQPFTHSLSFEADGKTDGPINAMVNFLSGDFTVAQIQAFAMGGYFVNQPGKVLSDLGRQAADLYTKAAALTEAKVRELMTQIGGYRNVQMSQRMNDLLLAMRLLPDVSYNPVSGEIVIKRGATKNPLTVSVYGAGVSGIAHKVLGALLEAYYEKLSELQQLRLEKNDPKLSFADLDPSLKGLEEVMDRLVLSKVIFHGKEKVHKLFWNRTHKRGLDYRDLEKLTIRGEHYASLLQNVQIFFAEPMVKGIEQMMGGTIQTMTVLQEVTQIQSLVGIYEFEDRLARKAEAKGVRLNQLSRADVREVLEEVKLFLPILKLDEQTANLAIKETSAVENKTPVVRGWDETFELGLEVEKPSEAGVKVSPFLTIMTGDGRMILRIAQDPELIAGLLLVFDGVDIPAGQIQAKSRKINEAVLAGWREDHAGPVLESFRNFLNLAPFDVLQGEESESLQKLRKDLTRVLDGDAWHKGLTLSPTAIDALIQAKFNTLQHLVEETQARKAVLMAIESSVDHMAGGGAPATNPGVLLTGSLEEQVAEMNRRLALKRQELQKARSKGVEIAPVDPGLEADFAERVRDKHAPAQELRIKDLVRMLGNRLRSPEKQAVLRAVSKALGRDTKVYFGDDPVTLTAFRNRKFPHLAGQAPIQLGQYDPISKTLFLARASADTALHELVHAATFAQVENALSNSEAPVHAKDAVQRLQTLMELFLDQDFTYAPRAQQEAAALVQSEIRRLRLAQQEAHAINEFMAWSLSQQELIDLLKATKGLHPVLRLVRDTIQKIRDVLATVLTGSTYPKSDFYSNIRFNTEILLAEQIQTPVARPGAVLQMASPLGTSQRLADLYQAFQTRLGAFLQRSPETKDQAARAMMRTDQVLGLFVASGFAFSPQEEQVFRLVQAAMSTALELDKTALLRAQRLFEHVATKLTLEDLMEDPVANAPQDRALAEERFKALTGAQGLIKDDLGRSQLLSAFVALAQVNEPLRTALGRMPLPKDSLVKPNGHNTREAAESLWDWGSQILAEKVLDHHERDGVVQDQLDRLTRQLVHIEADAQTWLEREARSRFDSAEAWLTERQEQDINKTIETLDQVTKTAKSDTLRRLSLLGGYVASLLSDKHATLKADELTHLLNQEGMPIWLRDLWGEVRGQSADTEGLVKLINQARHVVQSVRQTYREVVPETLEEQFTRTLTDGDWGNLTRAVLKTDLAALAETYSLAEIESFVGQPGVLDQAIQAREAELDALVSKRTARLYKTKIQELARYMVSGEVTSENHLPNAAAIAQLLGEAAVDRMGALNTPEMVKLIDELVSLEALRLTDAGAKRTLEILIQEEEQGMRYVLLYAAYLKRLELGKTENPRALINHHKGRSDVLKTDATTLIVAPDSDHAKLARLSYVRVADYRFSGLDPHAGEAWGYYLSPVAGRAAYNQGAMQTVQKTLYGVDAITGFTVGGETGGRLVGRDARKVTRKLLNQGGPKHHLKPGTYLMPVFGESGEVVAYQRPLDPSQLQKVRRQDHLAELMGAWAGRQSEEQAATRFNSSLIDLLHATWTQGQADGIEREFVNLADSDARDPVLDDTWAIIPKEMKAEIMSRFGPGQFWVRRNMLDNALGYRSPSVGDAFTGLSRWPEGARQKLVDATQAIFGRDAYAHLVRAERLWQMGVAEAKLTIVVRSGIVAFGNAVSNLNHLVGFLGVPWRMLGRPLVLKVQETNAYHRRKARIDEIDIHLRASDDQIQSRRLWAEKQSLLDANRSMSIWPLIEAGELNTISEGLTEQDEILSSGKIMEHLNALVERIPENVKTVGKYAVVSRDTELFKFMNRAVSYGDFLAKALYFDHLKSQGKSEEEALREIREEFINYNLLPGRSRGYLESMGLMWFWAYKLRSPKIVAKLLRRNPLRVLTWSLVPPVVPGSPEIDTVFGSSAPGIILSGDASWSLGTNMIEGGWTMNPWVQAMS